MQPKDGLNYQGDWKKDFNMDEERALSMYDVLDADTCRNGRYRGTIRVAFWSDDADEAPATLYYNQNGTANAAVKDFRCAEDQAEKDVKVGEESDPWGTVLTCDNGPMLSTLTDIDSDTNSPPVLILNHSGGDTYLVVEESSNYPSFLYSVWTNGTRSGDQIELNPVFHIGSTVRLAEAVVTAIVHGKTSGRECFMLVRENSEHYNHNENEEQDDSMSLLRAKPFGEDPTNDLVDIEDLETLECGLKLDLKALICLVFLALLTTVGIIWSFCLRSSIGMNVYDRDELIRAVSMSAAAKASPSPSAIRIFVRKEDSGSLSVVISDTGDAETGCRRMLRRGGPTVEEIEPAPNAADVAQFNDGFGGAVVPVDRPTTLLEGVRTAMGRRLPGRNGDFCYPESVTLSASAVPSPTCSLVGTPVHGRSPLSHVPRDIPMFTRGRVGSALFNASFASSDSGEDEPGGMQVVRRQNVDSEGAPSARAVAPGGHGGASSMTQEDVFPQGLHPPGVEGSSVSNRGAGTTVLRFSSRGMTPRVVTESSPVPQFRRDDTLGPPQLGPLSQSWGE